MERLFSLFKAYGASYYAVRQAAFMYSVPDLVRPAPHNRPEAGGGEAVAPLPAEGTETLLFGRRVDGAAELEAALLGEEKTRRPDPERPRDHGKIREKVAAT